MKDVIQPHKPKLKPKSVRKCMCCQHPFQSEGPHHRLCSRCRKKPGELSPFHP